MNFTNYVCEGQTDIFDFLQPTQEQRRRISLLSLFSGIGAFEKGLDRLGEDYELIAYCEIDKYASRSYSAIHDVSESMNLGDITKVDETALPKDISLLTYGFPCQDISLAGKQKGLFNEDGTQTRSGLFFEALRIIEATKPRVAIAENVKNLTSKKFKEQFKIVLDSLESAGYNNYWQVLNAKDYGIPQNRERVFIVSIRKDIDTGLFRFPEGFPLELRLKDLLEDEVEKKYYVSETALKGFVDRKERNKKAGKGFGFQIKSVNDISPTITARYYKDGNDCLIAVSDTVRFGPGECTKEFIKVQNNSFVVVREANKRGYSIAYEGDSINMEHLNSKTRRGRVGHGVAQTLTTSPQQGVVTVSYTRKHPPKENDVSTCLQSAYAKGFSNHNPYPAVIEQTDETLKIRKLTPKECFRLMDFDDADFEKASEVNSNTQLYKQAGNSIVVAVAYYIEKALIEAGVL